MQIMNFENANRKIVNALDNFQVLEYKKDASVSPQNAIYAYYMGEMNIRRRQVIIKIDAHHSAVIQAGAMQWMIGDLETGTGVKGLGALIGKFFKGAVTKESAVKPEYRGNGFLVLEPTYKHILLMDLEEWGAKGMTIEDGMFLACDSNVQREITARKNVSSAVLGGEGFFNMNLVGNGVVALESNVPQEELIEVVLQDDELKIDGDLAVCWSTGLDFTVEKSTKKLVGSVISGEGLVNVYRGTGRVLMSPVAPTDTFEAATASMQAKAAAEDSNTTGK